MTDYAELRRQSREKLRKSIASARAEGIGDNWISVHDDETIRAIDAPRKVLTAGNDKWSGSVDNDGVHLRDLTDGYNEPCEITIRQTAAKAYSLAAKVWDRVKQAATFSEASRILTEAGCRLHYYCAVD